MFICNKKKQLLDPNFTKMDEKQKIDSKIYSEDVAIFFYYIVHVYQIISPISLYDELSPLFSL